MTPRSQRHALHRSGYCRPHVELLEARFPPGDVLLGSLVGLSLVGPRLATPSAGNPAPESGAAEVRPFIVAAAAPGSNAVPADQAVSWASPDPGPVSGGDTGPAPAGTSNEAAGSVPAEASPPLLSNATATPAVTVGSPMQDLPPAPESTAAGTSSLTTVSPLRVTASDGVLGPIAGPAALPPGPVPVDGTAGMANGSSHPLAADSPGNVSLTPSVSSTPVIGEHVTWTATATGVGSSPVYQFSVGPHGGPLAMVRDFSPSNSFIWTPMQEGTYDIQVAVTDHFGDPVAASTVVSEQVNPLVNGTGPVVVPTTNPLVALYSAPPGPAGTLRVDFRPVADPSAPWSSTDTKSTQPGESTNFLIAGMLPSTTYAMVGVGSNGSSPVRYFTTGPLPASLVFPTFTVPQAPAPDSDLSQGLVFHAAIFGTAPKVNILATDLMGRVTWYYDPVAAGLSGGGLATSLVPGGSVLLMDGTAGYGRVLREIDLAGDTLRETNVDALNAELTARGQDTLAAIHHDAQRLPNGNTAILGEVVRTVLINGTPRQYAGDMVLVLDANFQVVWTWNAFNYLDVNRAPIGESTTTDPVDWLHSNAVSWSPSDGNLVVSVRNQDWVLKIAYANGTGDGHLVWKMGVDGDFTINSTDPFPWFSHQHHAHFIDNTTLAVFDNGNTRVSEFGGDSRGQVLTVNEQTHVVTPVLNADVGSYSGALGSAQKLPNGNYVFTSGFQNLPNGFGQAVELRPDGTTAYVLQVANLEYRSFRENNLYGASAVAASSTALTAPPASSLGQPVTLTATVSPVAPGSGSPTGTVTFQNGTTVLGTGTLDGRGVASLATAALPAGAQALTAVYSGDVGFTTSTSAPVSLTVNPLATTATLTSTPNPSGPNQPVTFTATIAPSAAGPFTPGGSVSFFDGGVPLGSAVPVTGGTARLTLPSLSLGTHAITAAYSGDANFTGSMSAADSQVVSQSTTTASLTSSPSPSTVNQAVTYTVTITPAGGSGTPTGTVTFLADGTAFGTASVVNGTATLVSSALAAGTHVVTSSYSGDANFGPITTAAQTQVVNPGPTATTVTTSLNAAETGRPVTFTATVSTTAAGSFRPGGTVTFFDGSSPLGQPVSLTNGKASLTTSSLAAGAHTITARYSGDNNFSASTSAAVAQTVRSVQFFALGGATNQVQVRRSSDGSLVVQFSPFGTSYTGGVTVALGDVNGDGFEDLIVGAASGTAQVKVYDGKALANGTFTAANAETHLLTRFTAYDSRYSVGVNVAAAYVNGTTDADIITGAASGNPHVKVFKGQAIANGTFNPSNPDASLSAQWFAYGVGLNIGATVAGGDLENDGFADVVTGASTGNPHVKVYSGRAIHNGTFNGGNPDASLLTSFIPYPTGMGLGVNVAVGDVNGDGFADLSTGPRTLTPDVRVYDGKAIATGTFNALGPDLQRLDQFFAFDPKYHTGVSLAAADFTGSGRASLLTAASTGAPDYRLVDGLHSTGTLPPSLNGIDAILAGFQGGLFVAG